MIICYYKSRLTPIVICLPIWSLCPKENYPVTCPSPKWMDTGMFFLFIGQLPTWLKGILLRNGPGMHTIGDTKYNHWFDGLARLHSFTFKNGKLLHIRLKKAQRPKSWCLMLLILFWLRLVLEWCRFRLQSGMSGEVATASGKVSPNIRSHLTHHSSSRSISAGLLSETDHVVLFSGVPKFSIVCIAG